MGAIALGIAAIIAALFVFAKSVEGTVSTIPKITATNDIDSMISYSSAKYKVEAALVKAVAMTESSLNVNATNPSDPSYGLMGIMPILAEDFGIVRDYHNATAAEIAMIRDPQTNLNIGAWFLSKLLGKYPFETAIQMYNVGESGYNSGRRNSDYLAKVTRYYNGFRNNSIG